MRIFLRFPKAFSFLSVVVHSIWRIARGENVKWLCCCWSFKWDLFSLDCDWILDLAEQRRRWVGVGPFSQRCFKMHPSFFNMKLGASQCYSEWNASFLPFESFLHKKVKKHLICETGVGACGPCCVPAWHGEGAASSCCVNRWEKKDSCHVTSALSTGDGSFQKELLPQSLSLFVANFTWILLFLHPVCPVIDSLVCSGGLVKGQATSEMLLPFPAWLRWGGTRAGQLSVFHTDVFLVSPHPGLIFGVFRVFFLVCLYSYLMWKNSYWILWFNIKLSALIPITCWHTADIFESRYTHHSVFLHLNQTLYSLCCISWIPHSLFATGI